MMLTKPHMSLDINFPFIFLWFIFLPIVENIILHFANQIHPLSFDSI